MSNDFPVLSWEFFREVIDVFDATELARIWGPITRSSIYRWARNPDAGGDCQPGPLLNMAALFRLLVASGHEDLALAGLRIVAEPCGAKVSLERKAPPPGLQPFSAAADCQEALTELVRVVRDKSDPKRVDQAANELARVALILADSYRQERKAGRGVRWRRQDQEEQRRAQRFWTRRANSRPWWQRLMR